MREIPTIADLAALAGQRVGTSDWLAGLISHSFRSPTQVVDIWARKDIVVIAPLPM